jgi:UDP-galactose transporter B1
MFSLSNKKAGGDDTLFGNGLLLGSLIMDGATGSLQEVTFEKTKASSYEMMCNCNVWSALYMLAGALASGQLATGATFCAANPDVLGPLAGFALCSAMGQVFIYRTLVRAVLL